MVQYANVNFDFLVEKPHPAQIPIALYIKKMEGIPVIYLVEEPQSLPDTYKKRMCLCGMKQ